MRNAPNFEQRLQRFFHDLTIQNYNSSTIVKLPFFGGYLELEMKFDNGMIDLLSAKTSLLSDVRKCEDFSLGYTDHVGMARSTSVVLRKFAQEGMSVEAKMFHEVKPVHNSVV
jgi:hypothetical protein